MCLQNIIGGLKMRKMNWLGCFLIVIIGIVFLAGCTDGKRASDSNGNKDQSQKTQEADLEGTLTISGSSAMQPLIATAAESFMDKHPNVRIEVNAGGSGTGLSEVAAGKVDIGNSDVFAEEKEGISVEELVDHKVAVVGMAPVAHPEIGIDQLSKEDLIKIFTGEITNWQDVGGANVDIVLVNRPDSSGTRATFVTHALEGATPAEGITEDSSNTVKKIVSETEGAIGYLAFSYITDDSITALALDDVEPTEENVEKGDFPIWAYQHSYTKGEPEGLEKMFLDYLMSDEVQDSILKDQGYISANKMQIERDAEGNEK